MISNVACHFLNKFRIFFKKNFLSRIVALICHQCYELDSFKLWRIITSSPALDFQFLSIGKLRSTMMLTGLKKFNELLFYKKRNHGIKKVHQYRLIRSLMAATDGVCACQVNLKNGNGQLPLSSIVTVTITWNK